MYFQKSTKFLLPANRGFATALMIVVLGMGGLIVLYLSNMSSETVGQAAGYRRAMDYRDLRTYLRSVVDCQKTSNLGQSCGSGGSISLLNNLGERVVKKGGSTVGPYKLKASCKAGGAIEVEVVAKNPKELFTTKQPFGCTL